MDKPGEHKVKQNKPSIEGQLLHISLYEVSKTVKFIKSKSGKMVARDQ